MRAACLRCLQGATLAVGVEHKVAVKLQCIVQFWYSSETAAIVAREAVKSAGDIGSIACIACPSLFRQIRAEYPATNVRLFEYDPRFEVRLPPDISSQGHL